MNGSLFEIARGYLTPDVVDRAASLVGESPSGVKRAMDVAIPSVVAGLASDAPSEGRASRVLGLLDETGLRETHDGISERLGKSSGEELMELGKDILGKVFGPRTSGVVAGAAGAAGVPRSSMSSLLALAAPLVMGAVGHVVSTRNLDASGLAALLAQQKTAAEGALGGGVAEAIRGRAAPREAPAAEPRAAAQPRRSNAAWALLLLIPVAIVAALIARRRPATDTRGFGVGVPKVEAPAKVEPPAQSPELGVVEIDLPNGQKLAVIEGSPAHGLAIFLATPSAEAPRRFAFDNLVFDHASGRLTPASLDTIDRVAEVLNAYPSVHVLVEGHTDSTGDPAGNVELSRRRADAVKDALVERGVAADRIETAGLGESKPVASNDTEEGRAKNRRTEIVVTAK
jgi:OmpA-OmpF porin, OOP family